MSYMFSLVGMNILKSVSWVISFLFSFPCRWQRADCAKCSCWMTGSWSCWFRYEPALKPLWAAVFILAMNCVIYQFGAVIRLGQSLWLGCVWKSANVLQGSACLCVFCGPIIFVEYWSNHMLHVKIPVLIICQPPSVFHKLMKVKLKNEKEKGFFKCQLV